MLAQRLMTAVALILMLVAFLFLLPAAGFEFLVLAFVTGAALEWCRLCKVKRPITAAGYAGLVAIVGVATHIWLADFVGYLLIVAVAWWLWAWHSVHGYPRQPSIWFESQLGQLATGLIVLLPAGLALVNLRAASTDGRYVLALLVLIWLSDSAAYFSGRRFGRRKLMPSVSPGKTVEGLIGGLAVVVIYAAVLVAVLDLKVTAAALLIVASIIVCLYGVLGDLVESLIKRIAGVKDSGSLFPGHGGILDRIDSVTAAAPVAVLLINGYFALA